MYQRKIREIVTSGNIEVTCLSEKIGCSWEEAKLWDTFADLIKVGGNLRF